MSLSEPVFFSRLKKADRVLIAGAGGGFDVYAGLPLAVALSAQGKRVRLANLSFANLDALDLADWVGQDVAGVHAGSASYADYFPERALADWLGHHPDLGLAPVVYAFPKVGVQPLRAAYRDGRASSTARSRPPCAASSVTLSSPAARREASCSSTR